MSKKKVWTREEVEDKIIEMGRKIWKLASKYAPDSDYLTISLHKDSVLFNNEHWELPEDQKIDGHRFY